MKNSHLTGGAQRSTSADVLAILGDRLAFAVLVIGIFINLLMIASSWSQPILDQHSFRQTQTAISAYWMNAGGPWLSYETPVLGANWAIPFEFPLYQWMVALLASALPLSIDQAGRVVSEAFFLAMLWPFASICRSLGADRRLFYLAGGLLLLSPTYIFWSRSLMIESTALFFSLGFVSTLLAHFRSPSRLNSFCMIAAASLAACIKITTFVGFAAAGAMITTIDLLHYCRISNVGALTKRYASPALAIATSLVTLMIWTRMADGLKAQTLIGGVLTSGNLGSWNFGTLDQRLSDQLWNRVVWGRAASEAVGGVLPLWLGAASALYLGKRALAGIAILIVLYVLPFLVFTNLHIVHNYYQYANSIFLVLGLAFVAWLALSSRAWLGTFLIVVFASFELLGFYAYFYQDIQKDMRQSPVLRVATFLRDRVPPSKMIVGFGLDWASDVPYYSQRKAMLFPDWHQPAELREMVTSPEKYTGGLSVGAIVECPNHLADMPDMRDAYLEYMRVATAQMLMTRIAGCRVFYRPNHSISDSENGVGRFYIPISEYAGQLVTSLSAADAATPAKFVSTCDIEAVDGAAFQAAPIPLRKGQDIELKGWVIGPPRAESTYQLRFERIGDQGQLQAPFELTEERLDIGATLGSAYRQSGFRLRLASGVLNSGRYHMSISIATQDHLFVCDNGREIDLTGT